MNTLFVDFHGTICHDDFWRSLAEEDFRRVQKALFETDASLVNEWMRGEHTSEEINGFAAERTGLDYDLLWQAFTHDCKSMRVSHELLSVIKLLRDTHRIVLITDNMDCFDRFTVPELSLNTVFDDIANSYNHGRLKTEQNGETFAKYLGGTIADAMLVDDSKASCQFFEKLGGTSYEVTKAQPAIRHLQDLAAIRPDD
jgi:FMN phosphatase YigB (HAD superfamily)